MTQIVRTTLDNGLDIAIEPMPGARSASLTWLTPAGSSREPKKKLGLCAMLSEMLLRGAGSLGSREHADALDRLGVSRGVQPTSLFFRLSATTVGDLLHDAMPLLADIVLRPMLPEGAVEQARDLATQALASLQDEPSQRAGLAAKARHHPDPINRDGYGTLESLASITREDLASFWSGHAKPGGSILCFAGAVDPDRIIEQMRVLTDGWEGATPELVYEVEGERGYGHITDDTNQCQIIVLHDAPREDAPEAALERAIASVLSGGMSGRLFSEVREKRGLCYSVHATYQAGKDFGVVAADVGTTPERAQESLTVLLEQLRLLEGDRRPVEADEFERMMIGLRSRTVFAGESAGARASALASDIHRLGRPRSLDEMLRRIESVTLEKLNGYASRRRLGSITVQTLGPAALDPGPLEKGTAR